jgi:hypothetical protein
MTARALRDRHRYLRPACAAMRRDRNAQRIRTVSWLLRRVGVAWVVLSLLIVSLMARASAPVHPQNEGTRLSILAAALAHVTQQERAKSASQEEPGVTWITARTARVLLQAKETPDQAAHQSRGRFRKI